MHAKHIRLILLIIGFFILIMTIVFMTRQTISREVPEASTPLVMPPNKTPGK